MSYKGRYNNKRYQDVDDDDDYYEQEEIEEEENEEEEYDQYEDEDENTEELIKKELEAVPFGMLIDMKQKQSEKAQQQLNLQKQKEAQERRQQERELYNKSKNQPIPKALKLSSRFGKREDKDAPLETTAKVPVSRYKQVVNVKKMVARDPRFDSLAGKFDEKLYREKYGFLDDIVKKDINKLSERLKETTDFDLQARITREIQSKRSKLATQDLQDKRRKLKEEWQKQEVENVRQGKKPFYLKQSALKDLEIKDKFKQLKEKKQLDKYMEKRRKKVSSKSKLNLPRTRRSAPEEY
ncbi:hypothetical protein PPL_10388 [Heterostelium album PN500]|uniref:rRNA biogenesis protein RRP36 n=1 Tax=Heterostelium pallidum (strain ATCC 26659 / Pp 5 / PN500) TaxID=670386 RepID=D3BQY5_HETP5|nr:hypothetical protein PPL_10388 [Heterostelium album PN500]EFA76171.1 hypothetical protein PPL_10388 [Heterostelium album PN500]|eukprot:XP_020428304.1 hypothetical protein PPL_10388 [Heterostelium album PN500]